MWIVLLPTPSQLTSQWQSVGFVPTHGGGPAPDFHRTSHTLAEGGYYAYFCSTLQVNFKTMKVGFQGVFSRVTAFFKEITLKRDMIPVSISKKSGILNLSEGSPTRRLKCENAKVKIK